MTRTFCSAVIVLLLIIVGNTAAQSSGQANSLQSLTVPQRVQAIERLYANQAGSRLIGDDQLEFYLDQIDAGWDEDRIRNDISITLRGGAWRAPAGQSWTPRNVTCSSLSRRYSECRTNFRNPPKLTFQFSNSACIEGRTWGHEPGKIWVDAGCRAQFTETQRGTYGDRGAGIGRGLGIVCESREGKRRRCSTDFSRPAELIEQFSSTPCIEGQTWGATTGEIWVSRGCRGRFIESNQASPRTTVLAPAPRPQPAPTPPVRRPGPVAPIAIQPVICSSENGRRRVCAWNRNDGRPTLVQRLSDSDCIEGRSWGYDNNELWVSRGCRAEFAPR